VHIKEELKPELEEIQNAPMNVQMDCLVDMKHTNIETKPTLEQ